MRPRVRTDPGERREDGLERSPDTSAALGVALDTSATVHPLVPLATGWTGAGGGFVLPVPEHLREEEDGYFELVLVAATPDDDRGVWSETTVSSRSLDGDVAWGRLELEPVRRFEVVVRAGDAAVPDATVYLTGEVRMQRGRGFPARATTIAAGRRTDAAGRVVLRTLAPAVDLSVFAPGRATAWVHAEPGAPVAVDLRPGVAWEGVVQGPDGQPRGDVSVSAEPVVGGLPHGQRLRARTDFEGRFRLEGAEPGRRYRVSARPIRPGGRLAPLEAVASPPGPLALTLPRGGRVQVVVAQEADRPFSPHVDLEREAESGRWTGPGGRLSHVRDGVRGVLAAGRYRARVLRSAAASDWVVFDVRADEDRTVRLVEPSARPLRGRVVDPLGRPVAGAALTARTRPRATVSVQSGPDGGFRFPDAPRGPFPLRVARDGFRTLELEADGSAEGPLEVVLEPE